MILNAKKVSAKHQLFPLSFFESFCTFYIANTFMELHISKSGKNQINKVKTNAKNKKLLVNRTCQNIYRAEGEKTILFI